jgi:hypothetical protein
MMLPVMLAAILGGLIVYAGKGGTATKALAPIPPKLPPTPKEIRMLSLLVLYDKDQTVSRADKSRGQAHLSLPLALELRNLLKEGRLRKSVIAVSTDAPLPEDERYLGRGFSVADAARIYAKLGRI